MALYAFLAGSSPRRWYGTDEHTTWKLWWLTSQEVDMLRRLWYLVSWAVVGGALGGVVWTILGVFAR